MSKHIRKGKTITTVDEGTKVYNSINEAKRASTAIQLKEDGALGRGSLRVQK